MSSLILQLEIFINASNQIINYSIRPWFWFIVVSFQFYNPFLANFWVKLAVKSQSFQYRILFKKLSCADITSSTWPGSDREISNIFAQHLTSVFPTSIDSNNSIDYNNDNNLIIDPNLILYKCFDQKILFSVLKIIVYEIMKLIIIKLLELIS